MLRFAPGIASCLHDLAGLDVSEGKLAEAKAQYRECLLLYGLENKTDLPRVLESLAVVARQTEEPGRALSLAGAAAKIRERYHVTTSDSGLRARTHRMIEAARNEAGVDATAHWMKGWNMTVEEIMEWAFRQGED